MSPFCVRNRPTIASVDLSDNQRDVEESESDFWCCNASVFFAFLFAIYRR
jgi:hypothetical protein